MNWTLVTATQFTKKHTEKVFEVLNIVKFPEEDIVKYQLQHHKIDLDNYSINDIVDILQEYGYSYLNGVMRDHYKNIVPEQAVNQIIVECISETQTEGYNVVDFDTAQDIAVYVKDEYGIFVSPMYLHHESSENTIKRQR